MKWIIHSLQINLFLYIRGKRAQNISLIRKLLFKTKMNDSEDKIDAARRISDSDIVRIPRMSIYSDELVATSEIFLKAREIAVNRFDVILNKK